MLYIMPITPVINATMVTPNVANSTNSTLTSFFWHAAPAQRFVFLLPSPLVRMVVRPHLHVKHFLLELEAAQ